LTHSSTQENIFIFLQAKQADKQPILARVTLKVAILPSGMLMFSFFLA
jgi:hypothetical protein